MEKHVRNVNFFKECKQNVRKACNYNLLLPSYPNSTTFNRNIILFTKCNDFTTTISQKSLYCLC